MLDEMVTQNTLNLSYNFPNECPGPRDYKLPISKELRYSIPVSLPMFD